MSAAGLAAPTGRMRLRVLLISFVMIAAVYCVSPVVQNGDSYPYPAMAWSLVHHQTLSLDSFKDVPKIKDHYAVHPGSGGHLVNRFPWVPSLTFVPIVVALDGAHAVGLGPSSFESLKDVQRNGAMQLVAASLVTSLVVVLVMMIAFDRLTGDVRRRRRLARVIGLCFAFATSAWSTVSRAMYQHGPALVFAAVAVLLAQRLATGSARRPQVTAAALGLAVAAAYTARPTFSVMVIGMSVFVLWRLRSLAISYFVAAAVVAALWCAVNMSLWGKLIPPYYNGDRIGIGGGFLSALLGVLVSPSRGLLLFCPIVLLAAARLWRQKVPTPAHLARLDVILGVMVVFMVCAGAALSAEGWWGGHSYGPRLSSDALVFIAALATPVVDVVARSVEQARASGDRRIPIGACVVAMALAWSFLVNAEGALSRSAMCWNARPNDIDAHTARLWDWGDSQLLAGPKELLETRSISHVTFGDDCAPER